ncbi:MAG: sugar ABC transporter substrate-binding protein [Verrucomicrobia bacterium]|nr:sugar ABC transporter substrate-binding protein [Verrucomicrobiota bacterium]
MRSVAKRSSDGALARKAALAGLACLALLTGCRRETPSPAERGAKQPVIGVSLMNLSSEFIVMLDNALTERARELGVKLIINDAQRNPERQVRQVESFIARGVDAIILNPCEVEASSPAVDRAREAGVPIVNVNSETRSQPTAFVGSRDEESARLAMGYLAKRLGGKGNALMMQGFMGQAAQIKRDRGAREVLAQYPKIKLLASQTAEWDRAKAMSLMENWIQSFGDKIDAVFAQNDEMAMGAVIALEQAKMKDRVLVAGVDAIADALQAVKDGRLDATVFQDARAQARAALDTVMKILRKQPYEREVYIPFRLVTRANVDEFLKQPRR